MKIGILLSGGIDSTSLLWWKRPNIAYTVDYGQLPARAEIEASTAICKRLKIPHTVIKVDCKSLGSGDLAGKEPNQHAPESDWWPFRNQLLVTLVAMKAITDGVTHLLLGTVKSDSIHKDGTKEFFNAISQLTECQEGNLVIEAPALDLSSVDLVRLSEIPLESLAWAHSCHTANISCGACRGCNKYFQVFHEIGYGLD